MRASEACVELDGRGRKKCSANFVSSLDTGMYGGASMEARNTKGGKNPGPERRLRACVSLGQVDLDIPGHRTPPVTDAIVMEEV